MKIRYLELDERRTLTENAAQAYIAALLSYRKSYNLLHKQLWNKDKLRERALNGDAVYGVDYTCFSHGALPDIGSNPAKFVEAFFHAKEHIIYAPEGTDDPDAIQWFNARGRTIAHSFNDSLSQVTLSVVESDGTTSSLTLGVGDAIWTANEKAIVSVGTVSVSIEYLIVDDENHGVYYSNDSFVPPAIEERPNYRPNVPQRVVLIPDYTFTINGRPASLLRKWNIKSPSREPYIENDLYSLGLNQLFVGQSPSSYYIGDPGDDGIYHDDCYIHPKPLDLDDPDHPVDFFSVHDMTGWSYVINNGTTEGDPDLEYFSFPQYTYDGIKLIEQLVVGPKEETITIKNETVTSDITTTDKIIYEKVTTTVATLTETGTRTVDDGNGGTVDETYTTRDATYTETKLGNPDAPRFSIVKVIDTHYAEDDTATTTDYTVGSLPAASDTVSIGDPATSDYEHEHHTWIQHSYYPNIIIYSYVYVDRKDTLDPPADGVVSRDVTDTVITNPITVPSAMERGDGDTEVLVVEELDVSFTGKVTTYTESTLYQQLDPNIAFKTIEEKTRDGVVINKVVKVDEVTGDPVLDINGDPIMYIPLEQCTIAEVPDDEYTDDTGSVTISSTGYLGHFRATIAPDGTAEETFLFMQTGQGLTLHPRIEDFKANINLTRGPDIPVNSPYPMYYIFTDPYEGLTIDVSAVASKDSRYSLSSTLLRAWNIDSGKFGAAINFALNFRRTDTPTKDTLVVHSNGIAYSIRASRVVEVYDSEDKESYTRVSPPTIANVPLVYTDTGDMTEFYPDFVDNWDRNFELYVHEDSYWYSGLIKIVAFVVSIAISYLTALQINLEGVSLALFMVGSTISAIGMVTGNSTLSILGAILTLGVSSYQIGANATAAQIASRAATADMAQQIAKVAMADMTVMSALEGLGSAGLKNILSLALQVNSLVTTMTNSSEAATALPDAENQAEAGMKVTMLDDENDDYINEVINMSAIPMV